MFEKKIQNAENKTIVQRKPIQKVGQAQTQLKPQLQTRKVVEPKDLKMSKVDLNSVLDADLDTPLILDPNIEQELQRKQNKLEQPKQQEEPEAKEEQKQWSLAEEISKLTEEEKAVLMPVDTNIKLSDVILSDVNKERINTFLNEIANQDKLIKYKLYPMNRLLFFGASGCGKTFLGKALANYLHYQMYYVDIAKALDSGNAAENLALVFRLANKGNSIIFIDECDSIAWNRDADSNDSGSIRRATNSLFQQIDQMNPRTIVICATNMLHRLDPAFERRFNMKMKFERPKTDLIQNILKFLYADFSLINDVPELQIRVIASRTNMSFFELQGIVERAMKNAVMHDTLEIKLSDIFKDIAAVMGVKFELKTDKDDPKIFESSIKRNDD